MTYEIWATPRNAVGSVAIPLQINLVVGPRLRTAIHKYDDMASTEVIDAGVESASQSTFDLLRLSALKQKLIADVEATEAAEGKVASRTGW